MKILSRKEIKKIIREEYELALSGLLEQEARPGERCGEPGSEYGQQDYKPKKKKSEAPDPDYDRFYAHLEHYKLLGVLDARARKGKKYGKDYWWGSRHQEAYDKLLCAAQADTRTPTSASKTTPQPAGRPQSKPPLEKVGKAEGDWCTERPWRNAPWRPKTAAFLEKNEKEGLVYYNKYPNNRPRGWNERIRLNMKIRVQSLMGWAKRYAKFASHGRLALSDNILEKMILNSGSVDKEGIRGMRANVRKMIDCELRHASGEMAGAPAQTPAPGVAPARELPVPDVAVQKPPSFGQAIASLKTGDTFSLKMRETVEHDPEKFLPSVTVFKAGETYPGTVQGNNIIIDTNWGRKSKTKAEFVKMVEEKSGGNPCSMVYCDESAIARGGRSKSFSDFLRNPNFA